MKRFALILFSLFILISLSSCSAHTKNVSVFYYDADDIFLNALNEKLTEKLSKNYNCKNYYAKKSQLKQNLQVDKALDDSSLLLMNMVDRLASGAIVEKCKKKNVPVVFFNREPLLEDMIAYDDCYYVGPNPDKQGRLQVSVAASIFGDPFDLNDKYDLNNDNVIQLVILKGEQGHQDAERRTQACLSELRQKGYNIELISIGVCNWSRQEAYNLFWRQYNTTLKNAELILSNNDEMAIGAANYIKSVSTKDEIIPIIGVDATKDGISAVENHLLYSTIVNDDKAQAEAVYQLAGIFLDESKTIDDLEFEISNSKFIYIDSSIYDGKEGE